MSIHVMVDCGLARLGRAGAMNENERNEEERDITSPPEETHEATTPPGSGDEDEEAVERGEDQLDQAGGGH